MHHQSPEGTHVCPKKWLKTKGSASELRAAFSRHVSFVFTTLKELLDLSLTLVTLTVMVTGVVETLGLPAAPS